MLKETNDEQHLNTTSFRIVNECLHIFNSKFILKYQISSEQVIKYIFSVNIWGGGGVLQYKSVMLNGQ